MNLCALTSATLLACTLCACESQVPHTNQSTGRDSIPPAVDSVFKASLPPTDTLRYPVITLDESHNSLNPNRGGKRSVYRIPSGQGLIVETKEYKIPSSKQSTDKQIAYVDLLTDHMIYRAHWLPGSRVRLDRTTLGAPTGRSVFRGLRPGQSLVLTFSVAQRAKGESQATPRTVYKTDIFVR